MPRDHDSRRLRQRRRRRALLAIAGLSALAGAVVGAGAGDDAPQMAGGPDFCESRETGGLTRAAGQGVMVRMEARAGRDLRRLARMGEIGGVILFPPEEVRGDLLARQIQELQEAAERGGNPPLLVAIDQEGGTVKRLPALAPQRSPYAIAQNDDPRDARLEGRATGFQLRELGIDVNLAPVLDVPVVPEHFMAPRSFGSTPRQVTRLGLAFATGQRREAVAATAKHFPGLGRAGENTDLAPTSIAASRPLLERDMAPFAAAVRRGIDLVMVASASYPALGADEPAVLSPAVVTGLLREQLGFAGVIVSDDLLAPAIDLEYPRREAAVRAARAGVDLLLYAARVAPGTAAALARAAGEGELAAESLRASCARVVDLKERLAAGEPLAPSGSGP